MLYAPQWFITLFAYNLNMETLLRIWDIMLYEGMKIVFKVSVFIMKYVEKELLKKLISVVSLSAWKKSLNEILSKIRIFLLQKF